MAAGSRRRPASGSGKLGDAVPELVSWQRNVRDRGGLARLDYTQNVINKTLVAPTARARRQALQSPRRSTGTNLTTPRYAPMLFTIRDFPRRLDERGDPFRAVLIPHQVLPPIT